MIVIEVIRYSRFSLVAPHTITELLDYIFAVCLCNKPLINGFAKPSSRQIHFRCWCVWNFQFLLYEFLNSNNWNFICAQPCATFFRVFFLCQFIQCQKVPYLNFFAIHWNINTLPFAFLVLYIFFPIRTILHHHVQSLKFIHKNSRLDLNSLVNCVKSELYARYDLHREKCNATN